MPTDPDAWRRLAAAQAGLLTRAQLAGAGVSVTVVNHRIRTERWSLRAPCVVSTFTGDLGPEQLLWLGVLHASPEAALVGGVHAASLAGLRNWDRPEITVVVPYERGRPAPLDGFVFQRTRFGIGPLRSSADGVPRCRIEPAILLFAARERSLRSAEGILAAAVQQGRASATSLLEWVDRLAPLRRAAHFREILCEIGDGAHSVAELDVNRMCRSFRLAPPMRQVKRQDASGRTRFTDCEWRLSDGRILVLEVDGSFHLDVAHWEDDIARQRSLSGGNRIIVRCTARELRDDPASVANDLLRLGVPRAA
jgi:very-short-patch-repair endonuclease